MFKALRDKLNIFKRKAKEELEKLIGPFEDVADLIAGVAKLRTRGES